MATSEMNQLLKMVTVVLETLSAEHLSGEPVNILQLLPCFALAPVLDFLLRRRGGR